MHVLLKKNDPETKSELLQLHGKRNPFSENVEVAKALSGFITASALLIMFSQVKPAIGLPKLFCKNNTHVFFGFVCVCFCFVVFGFWFWFGFSLFLGGYRGNGKGVCRVCFCTLLICVCGFFRVLDTVRFDSPYNNTRRIPQMT